MAEVILMPRLSDTMTEGVIASWQKKVGDSVKKGDVLAEIETDKATMELESYKNGTLLYIGAQKGEKIPVNGLLCIIGEKGKVDVEAIVNSLKKQPAKAAVGNKQEQESAPAKAAADKPAASEKPVAVSEKKETKELSTNGRLKASPLAKKLAKEKGIDLKA